MSGVTNRRNNTDVKQDDSGGSNDGDWTMDIGQLVDVCNGTYSGSTGVISKTSEKMVTIKLDNPFLVAVNGRQVTRKIVTIRKSSVIAKILQPSPKAVPSRPTSSNDQQNDDNIVTKLQNTIKQLRQQISDKNKYWKQRVTEKNEQIQQLVSKVEEQNKCIESLKKNKSSTPTTVARKSSHFTPTKEAATKPSAIDVADTTTPNKRKRYGPSPTTSVEPSTKKLKRTPSPIQFLTECQYTAKYLKNKILPTKPTHDWEEVAELLVAGKWRFEPGKNHLKFHREYKVSSNTENDGDNNSNIKTTKKQVITMSCTPGSTRTGKNIISDLKSRDALLKGGQKQGSKISATAT